MQYALSREAVLDAGGHRSRSGRVAAVHDMLLGPIVRWAGEADATVWVETDGPCTVSVGTASATFAASGHHYALVRVREEGPYEVALDGNPAGGGEIRFIRPGRPLRIAFGSCRVFRPEREPWIHSRDVTFEGRGPDALRAYAIRVRRAAPEDRPDALLAIGDQLYAEDLSPAMWAAIHPPRDVPIGEAPDFEAYAAMYREAWGEPEVAWLLANVPLATIFDDHDVVNGWNSSSRWRAWRRRRPGGRSASRARWPPIGSTSTSATSGRASWRAIRASAAWPARTSPSGCAPSVREADASPGSVRLSHARRLGDAKLVVLDTRCGRIVEPESARQIVDDAEWEWLAAEADADCQHLVLAMSLPAFLGRGIQSDRGDERGAGRRRVGAAGRPRGRVDAQRPPARALGVVPGLVRPARGAAAPRCRAAPGAGDSPVAGGRRASRVRDRSGPARRPGAPARRVPVPQARSARGSASSSASRSARSSNVSGAWPRARPACTSPTCAGGAWATSSSPATSGSSSSRAAAPARGWRTPRAACTWRWSWRDRPDPRAAAALRRRR